VSNSYFLPWGVHVLIKIQDSTSEKSDKIRKRFRPMKILTFTAGRKSEEPK